jgi:16S rRNA (guanine1516-N2)-methyltransferase
MAPVAVVVASDDATRSENLAAQLALPLLPGRDELPDAVAAYLAYRDNRLQLFPADAKQSGPVCVDFASDAAAYRLQSGGELIVKAVKGRSKHALRVVDATAGLGRDSFVLAAGGFEVTAVERDAVVAALLRDGLLRAQQSSVAAIAARIDLVHGEAQAYFATLADTQYPDVVYLDPMFAHSEKSALVKKEMRLFRQLFQPLPTDTVGDEAALLTAARAAAKLRVVVKRALKAPHFAAIEPAYTLAGKAIRFDVYPS